MTIDPPPPSRFSPLHQANQPPPDCRFANNSIVICRFSIVSCTTTLCSAFAMHNRRWCSGAFTQQVGQRCVSIPPRLPASLTQLCYFGDQHSFPIVAIPNHHHHNPRHREGRMQESHVGLSTMSGGWSRWVVHVVRWVVLDHWVSNWPAIQTIQSIPRTLLTRAASGLL